MALIAETGLTRPLAFRIRGWYGAGFLTPAIVAAAISAPAVADGSWADFVGDALGWVLFFAGVTVRQWATLYIGGRKGHEVVREGPYSVCRHPLYLGSFLLFLSTAAFLKSGVVLAAALLSLTAYRLLGIPSEEWALRVKLGAEYDDYARSTPCLWPRWSMFTTADRILVPMRAMGIECRRAALWLLFPIGLELIEHLREMSWWPHSLHLF
jgi:protein-S-isoprenylcysteine O-methyltransferase Ste14